MEAPAVMFIEMAQDWLKELKADAAKAAMLEAQQKELTAFGDERAKQLGASGLSQDFRIAYELGLQTLRCVVKTSPVGQNFNIDL